MKGSFIRISRKLAFRCSVLLLALFAGNLGAHAQTISATTYPFTYGTTGTFQDISTGATTLFSGSSDDGISSVTNIGFDFWFDGVRYTQFSVNTNGLMRLGGTAIATGSTGYTNNLASGSNTPQIAVYWDDISLGTNGTITSKTIGTAPNRTLVVQWTNENVPISVGSAGAASWQCLLNESTGIIQYVYGSGVITNSGGYSIGIANSSTVFASVTAATPTISYTTANNTNTVAIANGTFYKFTPNAVNAPTNLTVSGANAAGYTLNWTLPATTTGIVGYAIYSSTDNINFTYLTTVAGATTNSYTITGLQPTTTAYYKVEAYSEGAVSTFTNAVTASTIAPGNVTAVATGLWSAPSTWSTGALPTALDTVSIPSAYTVTIDGTGTVDVAYNISIAGTLQYDGTTTAKTLTIAKNVNVLAGGTFRTNTTSPASAVTHTLALGGDFVNSGALNFVASANSKATIAFTGAQSNVFNLSTGTTNNLFTVTENKTANTNILDFTPAANTTVSGANTTGFLTITSGTFKISGTALYANPVFAAAAYTWPAAGGFWLNNPNTTVVAQASSTGTIAGPFKVTQGTFNVGTAVNQNLTTSGASVLDSIQGGTINVAGFWTIASNATFTMTGGTVNVATVGNTSTTGSFNTGVAIVTTISGGTINIATAGATLDYAVASTYPTNTIFTGGTVKFGSVSGASFHVSGTLPSAVQFGTAFTKLSLSGATNSFGTIAIPTGDTLSTGGNLLTLLQNLTNDGKIICGVTTGGFAFTGTAAQSLSGAGSIYNYTGILTVNNAAGVTISQTDTVATTLNLTAGAVNGSVLVLGRNTGTLTTTVANGTITGAVAAYAMLGVTHSITYNTSTAAYTTGAEIGYDSVASLTVNNTSGITLNVPLYVKTTFVPTAGVITTSATNLLTLGTAVTPSAGSATAYVNGPLALQLNAAANTSRTFAIGKGGAYRPLTINNFESGGTLQTYIGEVVNGPSGGSGVTLDPARYYHLSNTANIFSTTTATATLTYGGDDGVTQGSGIVAQSATANGTYVSLGVGATTASTITSASSISNGGDYLSLGTGGACTAPNQPTALTTTAVTTNSVTVGFTANATAPTGGYIVVLDTGTLNQLPAAGTIYTAGQVLGNGYVAAVLGTTTTTAAIANLTGNTAYNVYVFPYNNLGCTGGPVYNTTGNLTGAFTTSCAAIAALSPTNITNTSFTLNFLGNGAAGGASTYTVDVSTTSTFTADITGFPVTTGNTSVPVSGLTTGTTYYYKITATGGTCGTSTSATNSIIMPVATPITLAAGSYNYDIIVNGSNNITSVNNASFPGIDHGGYDLVSADYTNLSGATGLPIGGSVAETNATYGTPGVVYQFAPYFQNNSFWFSSGNTSTTTPSTSTLNFATPIAASTVYVAYVSGGGASTANYTVNFSDGTTQAFTGVALADWCNPSNIIGSPVTAQIGRVSVTTANGAAANCPYVSRSTLALLAANYTKTITGVTIQITGSSYPAIMGITVQQPPTISSSVAAMNFGQTTNCATLTQYYTTNGLHLNPAVATGAGAVTVTAPTGFQVANGINGTYGTTASLAYINANYTNDTVYVKANSTTPGIFSGYLKYTGSGLVIKDSIALSDTVSGINISPATVASFGSVNTGATSASQSYTVTGGNLTTGSITATSSSAAYKISLDNTNFTSSVTIPVTGNTLAATIVYLQFDPTTVGAAQLDTVRFTGSNLTACAPYITATGNGANPCATPASPTNILFTATSTTDSIRFTAATPAVDGYLLVRSTAPYTGTTTDGTEYAVNGTLGNGTIIQKNISSVAQPYVVTGLTANTQYYFTLIPYNGGTTGTCVNGPLYGTPLSAASTTCAGTPGTPTASAVSASGFTVNYTAPAGGTATTLTYAIDVATDNLFTNMVAGSPFSSSTTSYTVTNVAGATFYFRVRAIGACTSANSATGTTSLVGNYVPVTLTPSSYNADVVADSSQDPTTTVSNPAANPGLVAGTPNSATYYFGGGYGFVAANYTFNPAYVVSTSGALPASRTINSLLTSGLTYQLAPYNGNNALTYFTYQGFTSSPTMTFATPQYASKVYVLATESSGASSDTIVVNFSDGTMQKSAPWALPEWFTGGAGVAAKGAGRINVGSTNGTNGTASGAISPTGATYLYQDSVILLSANIGKQITGLTFIPVASTTNVLQEVAVFAASVQSGYFNPSVTSLTFTNASGCAASAVQSFSFLASSLAPAAGTITATAPANFLVSSDNVNFASTATFAYTNSGAASVPVYVKFAPAATGNSSGAITFTGGTVNNASVAVTGTGSGVYASSALVAFGNSPVGAASVSMVDTVKATNVTGTITVASPNANFKVSLDNTTFASSVNITSAGTSNTPVYIQFTAAANGADSTLITLTGSNGTCTTPTIKATGFGTSSCATPANAPSAITFSNTSAAGTTVGFTPNGTPDGYLVLQSTAPFSGTPANNTNYTVGNTIGNAKVQAIISNYPTVISSSALTSQTGSAITGNTLYYVTVIPYNGGTNGTCGGGPLYAASNLAGSYTTCPVAPAAVTNAVTVTSDTLRFASSSGGAAGTVSYTLNVYSNAGMTTPITGSPFTVADNAGGSVTRLLSGLTSGATYYYNITANGACISTATTGTFTIGNYCTPSFSSGCAGDDHIFNLSYGGFTLTETNANCTTTNYLIDTSTVVAGVATSLSVTFGTTYSEGLALYVDFNNNGTFTDANETIATYSAALSISGTPTIPATIPSGLYRARLVNLFNGTPTGACMAGSYGDWIDFYIKVLAPTITVTGTPLSNFGTTPTCDSANDATVQNGTQYFNISGTNLYPATGNVVVNAPAGFQVSSDGATYGATASFGYTSNTLSQQTVYIEFVPTVVGNVTSNITFSGGGITNGPTVAVAGTGAGLKLTTTTTYAFGSQMVNTNSAAQVDTVKGFALTAGTITVTSNNTDFQVSANGTTWSNSFQITNGTTLPATPVFIRFAPVTSTGSAETGTISFTGAVGCVTTITATGTATPCVTGIWLGATSTDYGTASNWSCGTVPTATSAVIVPSGTLYMPTISSGSYSAASLTLKATDTLTLSAGATLSIAGNVSDSGSQRGAGTVILNGSTAQTITGNGRMSNVTLSNSAGATVTSGSTLNLANTLTVTTGTMTTNGGLVLLSDSTRTARIAALPATNSIVGNVKVQQYIPTVHRAFRFLGHPFSSAIALSQLETNVDITGSGGSTNGFTTTISNNPSAFWYNPLTGNGSTTNDNTGWIPFTSTNGSGSNAWNQYEGIRILVRGTPGQGLNGAAYTPSPVTINMTGAINQGAVTETMRKGANSGYNVLSNPYPSPVDIGTVIGNANTSGYISGAGYWVWDANQQTGGAYVVQVVGSGAYSIPANTSFVVNAAADNTPLTFAETNKTAATTAALLKANSTDDFVLLNLYGADGSSWDRTYINFNSSANAALENMDARKLSNTALDFYSYSADTQRLSIDARPYVNGEVIPLGIVTTAPQQFTIKVENYAVPTGGQLFLHDKYLSVYQPLSEGAEYSFFITTDAASQGNNRFELGMSGDATAISHVAADGLDMTMVPNPAQEQVVINYNAAKAQATVINVISVTGQKVMTKDLGTTEKGSITLPLQNLAAGMYMIELTSGNQVITKKLIKQ